MSSFCTYWNIVSDFSTVFFPLTLESTLSVNWGDLTGTILYNDTLDVSHSYAAPGQYSVSADGSINGWNFSTAGVDTCAYMLLDVSNVGNLRLSNDGSAFAHATKMQWSATDPLVLHTTLDGSTNVTNLANTFLNCASFNGDIGGWDTSSVVILNHMFRDTKSFNRDLSWNTGGVTDMGGMFEDSCFNGNISGLDVGRVGVRQGQSLCHGQSQQSKRFPHFSSIFLSNRPSRFVRVR